MNKKGIYLSPFFFALTYFMFAQQIITDNSQQPTELIESLVGENCVSVSNISSNSNGNANNIISYGSFDKDTSNFPLQSGIILSTGSVTSAGNSLVVEDLSDGTIEWETDSDILDVLGLDQTLNATSIEFDFVSAYNFVAFKYLFASDEYQQEYPCNFKDIFAILIKRAGTNDPYTNIALVPNTSAEISTNTIHLDISGFCPAENENYFQGYNIGSTNFNGHSTILTANSEVIPGETYHIKFVIADHIDERFDSAVFIEADSFGRAIDLGPDQAICGNDLTLNADIDNPLASYAWFLNGTQIPGENNTTLQVNQSGTYTVEVTIPIPGGTCVLTDTVDIEIIPFQSASAIENISICDPQPSDGFYNFDFPLLKNDEIFESLPSTNYNISYHLSEDEALNNNNPIVGLYQNTEPTETIYVRVESLSGDCLQIGSFEISIYDSPNTLEVTIDVCDGVLNDGGITVENFSDFDFEVANYEFNRTVTYHLTEVDAINSENAITQNSEIDVEPPFIFARVVDDFEGCFSIVKLFFEYQSSPELDIDRFVVNTCLDPDLFIFSQEDSTTYNYETLVETYLISDYMAAVEEMYPGLTIRLVTLIASVPPSITTSNPIASVTVGVSSGDYCEIFMPLEIHKNVLYNILGEEKTVFRCDNSSNDGIVDVDLNELSEELSEDYAYFDLTFYETETDRNNNINPLDPNTLYTIDTPTKDLFIASNYKNECFHNSKVTIELVGAPILPPQTAEACGNYNAETNTTTIQLTPFKYQIIQGLNGSFNIDFFATQEDAENNENTIESYNATGNNAQVFVGVINNNTGCYSVTTLDLEIIDNLDIATPNPIIACSENEEGFATVNLESVPTQIPLDLSNYDITFYETLNNALGDRFPIVNPNSYFTETQEVFIRIQRIGLECFSVISFEVLVFDSPQLGEIPDFINCVSNFNSSADFFFINKDPEILNGQEGMEVFYFENETDAINNDNPIDKTLAYQNTSNPQTIFVRLENEEENSCFTVAPIQIEVRQAPIFNDPTDVFECDINNNGLASTDLSEKITEIGLGSTTNLEITFHLTPLNAQLGTNQIPLNFTATSNPQLIYTRILNPNSGCFSIRTFNVNTLSLPEVNYGQSLITCGNNYDSSLEWDLTDIELIILEGRQYSIEFTYFESEEDLLGDTNAISNPETYTNISSPQTLYVRVRNNTTECFVSVPFELIINNPPLINEFEVFNICDNENNTVNLLDVNTLLLDNTFNILVSYYATEADAEADENQLNTDYIYSNISEILFARVEYSTTRCYAVYPFLLNINHLPIANQPEDIILCDDDYDGNLIIDLSQQNAEVLNNQNPNDYTVTYYHSEVNATESTNPLSTDYNAFNGETIFVRVEHNNTNCYAITQFIVVINPIPFIDIEDQVICSGNLPLVVSAETNSPTDTYLWSTNSTASEIEITSTGMYSVTVINEFGCQSISTFNVAESESAVIDVVETVDFSDPNNITITVNGIGDYLYQLNDLPFQASNVFVNVPIGYNTITIIDQNGCDQITREVLVIDTPKHLTPNNDGDFDTWHITGVETIPDTMIHIFDRYGKLLKQIGSDSPGWDGTFNGNKMPAGDYWYVAKVIHNGETFQIKGHFALKR
ncbi:choice-of-anchor L domain-containing protein [Winogradskyella sp.]|uniref:T9SS type B sorting domain-containing protein n=1 Tax=Winogradskyella sp. TaxID=1883156 RepID=UPI003F6C1AB5